MLDFAWKSALSITATAFHPRLRTFLIHRFNVVPLFIRHSARDRKYILSLELDMVQRLGSINHDGHEETRRNDRGFFFVNFML